VGGSASGARGPPHAGIVTARPIEPARREKFPNTENPRSVIGAQAEQQRRRVRIGARCRAVPRILRQPGIPSRKPVRPRGWLTSQEVGGDLTGKVAKEVSAGSTKTGSLPRTSGRSSRQRRRLRDSLLTRRRGSPREPYRTRRRRRLHVHGRCCPHSTSAATAHVWCRTGWHKTSHRDAVWRLNDMPVVTFRNIDARLRPTHTNKGALRGVRGIEARGSVTAQALSLLAGARVRCVRS